MTRSRPSPKFLIARSARPDSGPLQFLAALLLLAGLACFPAPLGAQLNDDATTSTIGTQFVGQEDPKPEEEKPEAAPPSPPPVNAPAAITPPAIPAQPARYPSVVFLVDTSDSMLNKVPGESRTRLDQAKSALTRVLKDMSTDTRVQIWTFNTRLHQIRVRGVRQGRFIPVGKGENRAELMAKVQRFRTAGGTNLYQSIVKALDLFAVRRDQPFYRSGERFPVLVVLSDGEDSGKTRDVLETVLKKRKDFPLVTINTIGFQVRADEGWFRILCQMATRPTGCSTAGDEEALHRMLESFYHPPQ